MEVKEYFTNKKELERKDNLLILDLERDNQSEMYKELADFLGVDLNSFQEDKRNFPHENDGKTMIEYWGYYKKMGIRAFWVMGCLGVGAVMYGKTSKKDKSKEKEKTI